MTNPLVSVNVITYNSSKFIRETLDSIYTQTYQNIELIICDDCSTDDTVSICFDWVSGHKDRFQRVEIVEAIRNTGITGNCNRGLRASTGEWIKPIAGDDMLLKDCLQNYIDYLSEHYSDFVFALPVILSEVADLKDGRERFYSSNNSFFKLTAQQQFRFLLVNELSVNAATLLFNRSAMIKLQGFDESYKCEDLPIYLKATCNGFRFAFLAKETVRYRIHADSLSYVGQQGLINRFWFNEQLRIRQRYFTISFIARHPLVYFEFLVQKFAKIMVIKLGNKEKFQGLLNYCRLLSPLFLYNVVRKRINGLMPVELFR